MKSWKEDVVIALTQLGGTAPLAEIYEVVRGLREGPHPENFEALVRGTLEKFSSDSEIHQGDDRFFSVKGIGNGIWGLRGFSQNTTAKQSKQ